MDRGQLIAVNGAIYEYDRYDKYLDVHFASEIEIDEDGHLTATYVPCCFSPKELTEGFNTIQLTEAQWYGVVRSIITQNYFDDLTYEQIEDATEDIVGREFAYGVPKFNELSEYIADYMNR